MDSYGVQVVVGYVMTWVLELLKKASWFPVLSENSTHVVKVACSWIVAACSALAVTFSFDSTLGRLTIDGLTFANIKGGVTAFIVSLIAQKITYRVAIAPKVTQ
jgi:hypothetical protein